MQQFMNQQMIGMYGPNPGPYNYQYVQDKEEVHTDISKDLNDKIQLAEKKESTKSHKVHKDEK